jgi:hypothetical protein
VKQVLKFLPVDAVVIFQRLNLVYDRLKTRARHGSDKGIAGHGAFDADLTIGQVNADIQHTVRFPQSLFNRFLAGRAMHAFNFQYA